MAVTRIFILESEKNYDKNLYDDVFAQYEDFQNSIKSTEDIDSKVENILKKDSKDKIIGKVSIPAINIEYPIINSTEEEYMKIAPIRYCGAVPNSVGNMVVIGHNYYDGTHFSNLTRLVINDEVLITDYSGNVVKYRVYDMQTIEPTDFSCTRQDDMTKSYVTLMTCTNGTKNRYIVKCVEM